MSRVTRPGSLQLVRMKLFCTILILMFSDCCHAQYFHYMHTYDTTGDVVRNILRLPDGNLLVSGSYLHYHNNNEDAFWLKISSDGNTVINKYLIHTDSAAWYMNYSGNIKPIASGGYVLPYNWFQYNTDPDRWQGIATLVFLNSQLDTVSVKRYTDSALYSERVYDCAILHDESYLLGGDQYSSYISQQSFAKAMLMRVDAQGNLLWKQTYQKEAGKSCYMMSVQPLDNNRSLIGACSEDQVPMGWTYYYRQKPWFVIVDNSNGAILKDTMYATGYAHMGIIYKAMDGGYYHIGRKDSVVYQDPEAAHNFPAYIAHLDTNFNIDWLTSMPFSFQPYLKEVWKPRQLQNGDYLLCGTGLQDGTNYLHGWVARINSSGAILWSKYYYSQINQYAYLVDFFERPEDGNIILCGWTRNDTLPAWRGQELWLLGLYADGVVLTGTGSAGNIGVKTMEFDIYPNPSTETFYLDVPEPGFAELYDMSGRQVAKYDVPKRGKIELRLGDRIAAGNYLLQFTGGESKMVAGKQLVRTGIH